MKQWIVIGSLMVAALFLLGCQAESEPEVAVIPTLAAEVAGEAPAPTEPLTESAAPRPDPTDLPEPDEATAPTAEPTAAPAEETVAEEPTAEAVEPEPVAEIGFGMVDGTFYRGSPNAPVRLIDYSDFL